MAWKIVLNTCSCTSCRPCITEILQLIKKNSPHVSGSLTITPSKGVFSVAEGSYLQVNCSSRNGVQWSAVPSEAMSTLNQGSVTANGDNISTLTFEQVIKANEATFTCKDATSQEEQSFQLKVFNGKCWGSYWFRIAQFEKDISIDTMSYLSSVSALLLVL